jgi:hypothetical protein
MFNIVKERGIFYSVNFAETISSEDLQISKLLNKINILGIKLFEIVL